jgi:hypothetical protein
MATRRKSPSKVDLQAVLRFVAAREWVESAELMAWIVEAFGCRERAAKDNVSVLVQGGWLGRERDEHDRRRLRYAITEKGREDMVGSLGQAARTALLLNLPERSEPSPAGGAAGTSRESARPGA